MPMPLNCLLVALWVWAASRGRTWLAWRRSRSLGAIPHFAVFSDGTHTLYLLEYIPRRAKAGKCAAGDPWPLFRGRYRLARYRLEREATGDSFAAVARQISTKEPACLT